MPRYDAEYVLPILRRNRDGEDELIAYLEWLSERMGLTVIDGSEPPLFNALGERLPEGAQHLRPRHAGLNGKACGVMTGVEAARAERIVLADDDVRYDAQALADLLSRLEEVDLVRPQNVFSDYPWHARWDTARMLIGRAFGGDFGGTLGIRRSGFIAAGGYSTDVLFENLELERTIRAVGGRVDVARDLFVLRIPPTASHFVHQRVRQAYDDFAQPARLLAELAIVPLATAGFRKGAWRVPLVGLLGTMAIAEAGRRIDGGAQRFPPWTVLWAPMWVMERGIAVWAAAALRLRGGVTYSSHRIYSAATPLTLLQQRRAVEKDAT